MVRVLAIRGTDMFVSVLMGGGGNPCRNLPSPTDNHPGGIDGPVHQLEFEGHYCVLDVLFGMSRH